MAPHNLNGKVQGGWPEEHLTRRRQGAGIADSRSPSLFFCIVSKIYG
jgi:hypothetical protein